MFGSYWYIEGADGRHYCYAKDASYECPVGAGEMDDILRDATNAIGFDEELFNYLVRRWHHSAHRRRIDGKLTDLCESCGHKLTRRGVRYWIEGPPPKDGEGMARVSRQINLAMGGSGFTTVEGPWYAKTRKAAQEWARMRVRQTKEA